MYQNNINTTRILNNTNIQFDRKMSPFDLPLPLEIIIFKQPFFSNLMHYNRKKNIQKQLIPLKI